MIKVEDLKNRLTKTDDPQALILHQYRNTYTEDAAGNITGLNCCESELKDDFISALQLMPYLKVLNLSGNNFTSVTLPATLTHLQYVDFSDCPALKCLKLPGDAGGLVRLDISDGKVGELVLPDALLQLEWLDVSRNELADFTLSTDCPALTYADFSINKINRFFMKGEFLHLKYLYLYNNGMTDLTLDAHLPALQVLHLSNNNLRMLPNEIILADHLEVLYAFKNRPKNIPDTFLGNEFGDNCINDARIWFKELRDYPTDINKQVKMMITGNGDTGKSTLLCALKNDKCTCSKGHHSTHGIQIGHVTKDGVQFNVWDFGGQEIYHGTHRLFMESPAVQVLVFDPKTEKRAIEGKRKPDRINQDLVIDHPIEYWYDTAKALSPQSPFIFVQNKEDILREEYLRISKIAKDNDAKFVHISAQVGTEMDILWTRLVSAAKKQLPEYGMVMPQSWLAVRQGLLDKLETGEYKKTISRQDFDTLCIEKQVNPATKDLLLRFLHHGGYIYRSPHLGDTIIIDQQWALEAIYKILQRDAPHFIQMKAAERGEISVYKIFDIFGQDYTDDQKQLFLKFMESCGICFKINTKESNEQFSIIDTYLFPEFLSEHLDEVLEVDWNKRTTKLRKFRYPLPYPNYPRLLTFITALGRKTKTHNIWRNGIMVQTTDGWFRVEMDYQSPAFILTMEEKAVANWIKIVSESLSGRYSDDTKGWHTLKDQGEGWESFDMQTWGQKMEKAGVKSENLEKVSFSSISDLEQETFIQRVLVLSANPLSTQLLSASEEFRYLSEQIDLIAKKEKCEPQLRTRTTITLPNMNRYIRELKPHIIHFIGHGQIEDKAENIKAGLVFNSDDFRGEEILDATQLESNFRYLLELGENIPLHTIYLNACLSSDQAKAISSAGLTVIGANDKIYSVHARRVAAAFYVEYSKTKNVLASFKIGLANASHLKDTFEVYQNGNQIIL